jgi:uncharacterized protein
MLDLPQPSLKLRLLPDRLMVCRLPAESTLPTWMHCGSLTATVRTADELSIVCADTAVPIDVIAERGWRALKVEGPLEFSMVGVLASLAVPLAQAGVSIFVLSTYDTDYLLLKDEAIPRALSSLRAVGLIIFDND